MSKGTQSNRLTLVDNRGAEIQAGSDPDGIAIEYLALQNGSVSADISRPAGGGIGILIAVSAACATAAIATGIYAYWLLRHTGSAAAFSGVQDLVENCRNRMSEIEYDLDRFSQQLTSVS